MARSTKTRAAGGQEQATPESVSQREARRQSKRTAKSDKRFAKAETARAAADKQRTEAEHKQATQRIKADQKQAKQQLKADQKQAKQQDKARKKGEHGRISPGNAKKIVGVAGVLGPVIAPYAAQAASTARDAYDRARARRLGVPVDDLGSFTGKGAALHARIAGDNEALQELRTRGGSTEAGGDSTQASTERFVSAAEQRLIQLTSAVRAAERMPVARRRAAHRSVSGELDRIEKDLMDRLGVQGDP